MIGTKAEPIENHLKFNNKNTYTIRHITMATQVKFHILDEDKYSKITSPDQGSLYFIDDNGEIRKGGKHITGTRVFTATDPNVGSCSSVDALEIQIDGVSITTEGAEQPKRGDMLVVSHELVTGKNEYSAYIYGANGGAYDPSKWVACDGKVSASNVILTQDITMAGNYTQVGNLTKASTTASGTFATQGKSVAEAFQEIFTKKLQPTATAPAVTLTLTNNDQLIEVGSTSSVPTYTASLSAGSYTYGPATGITASAWNVTDGKNTYTTNTTTNLPTIKANDGSQSYTVTATATHNGGSTPVDNLGGTATIDPIPAGTKSKSGTVKVTGFRKWFYGVDRDGTGTIDSNFIRGLTNGGNCETTADKTINPTGEGAVRIVVAIPKKTSGIASIDGAKTLKDVLLVSASNTPILDKYVKQDGTVNVNDVSGENPIPYEIWIYKPASISPTEVHQIKVG